MSEFELAGPTMRRIYIRSEALGQLPYNPAQHVRIQINDPSSPYGILRPMETLRTYTIWEYSVQPCVFELRIHLYDGNGIGLNWANNVKP